MTALAAYASASVAYPIRSTRAQQWLTHCQDRLAQRMRTPGWMGPRDACAPHEGPTTAGDIGGRGEETTANAPRCAHPLDGTTRPSRRRTLEPPHAPGWSGQQRWSNRWSDSPRATLPLMSRGDPLEDRHRHHTSISTLSMRCHVPTPSGGVWNMPGVARARDAQAWRALQETSARPHGALHGLCACDR
jgi:hypothetical protein